MVDVVVSRLFGSAAADWPRYWAVAWFCVVIAFGVNPQTALSGETLLSDAEARAALIYQFGRFTQWPKASISQGFLICLAGEQGALARSLATLEGKSVRGKPLKFRGVSRRDNAENCNILVIAEPPLLVAEWLRLVGNRPVLTISHGPGFVEAGGMIAFVTEGDRLRFDVNIDAIEQSMLSLNAQVISLARNYRGRS